MLFNSYGFIFGFLPAALAGFFLLGRWNHRLAALWLVGASFVFYGWWSPPGAALLLASILGNYGAGRLIARARTAGPARRAGGILAAAVAVDLLLLGIFKYANFFLATANSLGAHLPLWDIVLPLGISFFTFTQIAFLVDVRRGLVDESDFVHYLLFVTWFPHLLAGPVLHHKQMMPQFAQADTYRPQAESFASGLTLFSVGLFKKTMLADTYALYANPVFDAAARGVHPMLLDGWFGVVAYALQLYFDFSGYSDMAIGLSRLFNVTLPFNFNSPYQATSIIDFWRRWHMTLAAFLRDYVYIPLGGNRHGRDRRQINLMVTMLLGGLWHGAGWNFVLWGGLHGGYLAINHAWRALTGSEGPAGSRGGRAAGRGLTFLAVAVAWVPFRAATFGATQTLLAALAGLNGTRLALAGPEVSGSPGRALGYVGAGLAVVWFLPNSQQWLAGPAPAGERGPGAPRAAWYPSRRYALLVGALLGASLLGLNRGVSEFLYYRF